MCGRGLAVLSEIPEEFAETIARWAGMNAEYKRDNYPDANSEYFLYQTLIGAWPIDADAAEGLPAEGDAGSEA